jgi:hypothetical protein
MAADPLHDVRLSEEALARIAASLSDLYYSLYEERPSDPQSSLTGNMLAFVFQGGLSVADEWLLKREQEDRLCEFRKNFFEVVSDELVGVVGRLTGLPVSYSFYGFDPGTRTTHANFVLDLSKLDGAAERQAVLNWSEQVRRNSKRLREEHREVRDRHIVLTEEWHGKRESLQRNFEAGADLRSPSDDR